MSKIMVLHGLPIAGAYQAPPGRVLTLGRLNGLNGRSVRGAIAGARLRGLGSPATDRATAIRIAAATRDTAKSLCLLINHPTDTARQTRERAQCQAAADAAYSASVAAIEASIRDVDPVVTPSDPSTTTADYIARLEELERLRYGSGSSSTFVDGGSKNDKILGMPKNTAIGVGLGAAFIGGLFLLLK